MARLSVLCVALLLAVAGISLAEDAPPVEAVSPQVSDALFVRSTEALIHFVTMLYGPESMPEDALPLPWAQYLGDNTGWMAGRIVTGDKCWNIISFPMKPSELDFLPSEEKAQLLQAVLDHPIGKLFFPDGEAEIRTLRDVGGTDVVVVGKDFHDDHFTRSGLREKVNELISRCDIGYYGDSAVQIPGEESTVAIEDATSEIYGISWAENQLSFLGTETVKDGSSKATALQARMTCQLPYRVRDFVDKNSPFILYHRFFAEEAGLWYFRAIGGGEIKPVESRDDASIYNMNLYWHFISGKESKESDEYPFALRKSNFTFVPFRQNELPPEDGVPSAEEMNAANIAFWKSLEPLIDDIAAKIGVGNGAPVDIGGKYEDGMLLFAIATQPGENEPVIDWNRLNDIDMSFIQFPNPYREDESERFEFHVDVHDAGQWGLLRTGHPVPDRA
jgi:hypothetical protein